MSETNLRKFLKVAGGLALAAPALSACDAICGACCAAKGACSAYAEGADGDHEAGCCAAQMDDGAMAEHDMDGADEMMTEQDHTGCCAAAE